MAAYSVVVTYPDGLHCAVARHLAADAAARIAQALANAPGAQSGFLRTIQIKIDGGGAVWEWRSGQGVISE